MIPNELWSRIEVLFYLTSCLWNFRMLKMWRMWRPFGIMTELARENPISSFVFFFNDNIQAYILISSIFSLQNLLNSAWITFWIGFVKFKWHYRFSLAKYTMPLSSVISYCIMLSKCKSRYNKKKKKNRFLVSAICLHQKMYYKQHK